MAACSSPSDPAVITLRRSVPSIPAWMQARCFLAELAGVPDESGEEKVQHGLILEAAKYLCLLLREKRIPTPWGPASLRQNRYAGPQ